MRIETPKAPVAHESLRRIGREEAVTLPSKTQYPVACHAKTVICHALKISQRRQVALIDARPR